MCGCFPPGGDPFKSSSFGSDPFASDDPFKSSDAFEGTTKSEKVRKSAVHFYNPEALICFCCFKKNDIPLKNIYILHVFQLLKKKKKLFEQAVIVGVFQAGN